MEQNIKVLMLGRYDSHQTIGGVQHYARTVIDGVGPDIKIDAIVSSSEKFSDTVNLPNGKMQRVGTLGIFASTPISPFMFFKLWKMIRSNKYDIIHFNFPDPLTMFYFLFLKKRAKYLVSWHSDVVKQKWALWFYLPMLSRFLKLVDLFLVATESHFRSSTQLLDLYKDKVQVVPYGIPPAPNKDFDIPSLIETNRNKKAIFTLGRHVYYKGYEYLIEAMKSVENSIVIMASGGPLTDKYKELIQQNQLENKVFLVGKLSDEEVLAYFKHCDLFCLPSIEPAEAFGYVQVEAMRFGKPIINCNLDNGVNEVSVHGESGLTVSPRNAEQLAGAINKLTQDKELYQKLSQGALNRAQRFSMANFIRLITETYKNLADDTQ